MIFLSPPNYVMNRNLLNYVMSQNCEMSHLLKNQNCVLKMNCFLQNHLSFVLMSYSLKNLSHLNCVLMMNYSLKSLSHLSVMNCSW